MSNILKWPGAKKQEKFTDYTILVDDPEGGKPKHMLLSVNQCIQHPDSDDVPVILLDGGNITDDILGLASCDINFCTLGDNGENWSCMAKVITPQGVITMRGIHWHTPEAPFGYEGDLLPLWHMRRAADLNQAAVSDDIRRIGGMAMKDLKDYCDYVYSDDKRDYILNAGMGL